MTYKAIVKINDGDVIFVRSAYNSIEYWEKVFRNNNTIKSKIFIDEEITEKTVYLHYVIFNRKSGIESVWLPMPSVTMLVGFIQYCFLPEAFYKWSEGKSSVATKIPSLSVDNIVALGAANGKLDKREIQDMRKQIAHIRNMWRLPSHDLIGKLKSFSREFNRVWIGDSTEFLYLNVFKNAEELGSFILNTNIQTDFEKRFEEKIGLTEQQWINLCKNASKDQEAQIKFKEILSKHLSEVI